MLKLNAVLTDIKSAGESACFADIRADNYIIIARPWLAEGRSTVTNVLTPRLDMFLNTNTDITQMYWSDRSKSKKDLTVDERILLMVSDWLKCIELTSQTYIHWSRNDFSIHLRHSICVNTCKKYMIILMKLEHQIDFQKIRSRVTSCIYQFIDKWRY